MEGPLLNMFFPKECVHTATGSPPLAFPYVEDERVQRWLRELRVRRGHAPDLDDAAPVDVMRGGADAMLGVLWRVVVEPLINGSSAIRRVA